MSSPTNQNAVNELLGLDEKQAPSGPTKKKFASSKGSTKATKAAKGKKASKTEEEDPDKKYPFTSTITGENKRRFANYQANKPGGCPTTDLLNAALKMFFDDKKNKQYADLETDAGEE